MKTLVMKFITETGTKVSLNVPDTKIKEFMELVKEKAVFTFKGGDIIAIDSASLTETTTTDIALQFKIFIFKKRGLIYMKLTVKGFKKVNNADTNTVEDKKYYK